MEKFICPQTNQPCPQETLCMTANEPLDGAIATIRQAVGGIRRGLVVNQLQWHISVTSQQLEVALPTSAGANTDIRMCPTEAVDGDLGHRLGQETVAAALAVKMQECVDYTISDLRNGPRR